MCFGDHTPGEIFTNPVPHTVMVATTAGSSEVTDGQDSKGVETVAPRGADDSAA